MGRTVRILSLTLLLALAACGQTGPALRDPVAVEVTSDLAYTEPVQDFLSGQKLDVYAPVEGESLPVLVLVHGAGGVEAHPLMEFSQLIAEQGVVVFTPTVPVGQTPQDLTISKGRKMREALESVVCAVRFARAQAADYGGDTDRIALVGHSAGGFLGLLVSLMGDDLAPYWETVPEAPPQQVECLESQGASGQVQAFVGLNGSYFRFSPQSPAHVPEIWPLPNPYEYVGNNTDVELRLMVGGQDEGQPDWHKDEVPAFVAELSDYDAQHILIEEAGHGIEDFEGPVLERVLEIILGVLKE